jgi:hypothetical protein
MKVRICTTNGFKDKVKVKGPTTIAKVLSKSRFIVNDNVECWVDGVKVGRDFVIYPGSSTVFIVGEMRFGPCGG